MGDIDCDDFGIDSAMRRARRIRWVNSRTVPYVAHDADDCASGLETRNGWPAAVVAPSNERNGLRWFAARCYYGGDVGLIFRWFDTEAEALTCAAGLMSDADTDPPGVQDDDCAAGLVVARPSPGDDITCAAFDAMDRQASPLRTDR